MAAVKREFPAGFAGGDEALVEGADHRIVRDGRGRNGRQPAHRALPDAFLGAIGQQSDSNRTQSDSFRATIPVI